MKKFLIILLVSYCGSSIFAQSETHSKVLDTFVEDFNSSNYIQIYESFSPRMRKAKSKNYYISFLTELKRKHGRILRLDLLEYFESAKRESRAIYDGVFESEVMEVRFSVDAQNRISGLYFKKRNLM